MGRNLGMDNDGGSKFGGVSSYRGGADYSSGGGGGGVDYSGGVDMKSRMAMFSQGSGSNSGYKRPGAGASYKPPSSTNQFIGGSSRGPNVPVQSYLGQLKSSAPPPPVNSMPNGYGEEEGAAVDFRSALRKTEKHVPSREVDSSATVDFRSALRKTGNISALDAEIGRTEYDDGEGQTVNFQGMLRSTGKNRESMKRGMAQISVGYGQAGFDIPRFME